MDAYKAVTTKRDTRLYSSEPIDDEVLRRVLPAGRMAGAAKNLEPFRFVVIRDKEHMAKLAECGDFAQPLGPATAAVAVCLNPDGMDFDAGRGARNRRRVAWEEGLASCPLRLRTAECGREVLSLPEWWQLAIVVALGHPQPGTSMSQDRARQPFEEYVSWERFGQSSP